MSENYQRVWAHTERLERVERGAVCNQILIIGTTEKTSLQV